MLRKFRMVADSLRRDSLARDSALQAAATLLTPENLRLVTQTRIALDGPAGLRRLLALHRLGLHRQTRISNLALYGLTLLHRL